MERLGVPLIGGVAEHEALVASTKFGLDLVAVDCCHDVGILSLDVCDDLTVGSIKANLLSSVAYLTAHIASDLLKVHLVVLH